MGMKKALLYVRARRLKNTSADDDMRDNGIVELRTLDDLNESWRNAIRAIRRVRLMVLNCILYT